MARIDRVTKSVTSVSQKRNVTTGNQINIRLTDIERDALKNLVEKVQQQLPQKNISRSKVIRAITHINKDSFVKKIAKSICDNV